MPVQNSADRLKENVEDNGSQNFSVEQRVEDSIVSHNNNYSLRKRAIAPITVFRPSVESQSAVNTPRKVSSGSLTMSTRAARAKNVRLSS